MGAGGALPNASALAAEFAPVRRRAAAVKLTIVCVPLGGMLGGLIAARVLPAFGWRALYQIGGAAPLLCALLLWAALPESPRFLAQRPARWLPSAAPSSGPAQRSRPRLCDSIRALKEIRHRHGLDKRYSLMLCAEDSLRPG